MHAAATPTAARALDAASASTILTIIPCRTTLKASPALDAASASQSVPNTWYAIPAATLQREPVGKATITNITATPAGTTNVTWNWPGGTVDGFAIVCRCIEQCDRSSFGTTDGLFVVAGDEPAAFEISGLRPDASFELKVVPYIALALVPSAHPSTTGHTACIERVRVGGMLAGAVDCLAGVGSVVYGTPSDVHWFDSPSVVGYIHTLSAPQDVSVTQATDAGGSSMIYYDVHFKHVALAEGYEIEVFSGEGALRPWIRTRSVAAGVFVGGNYSIQMQAKDFLPGAMNQVRVRAHAADMFGYPSEFVRVVGTKEISEALMGNFFPPAEPSFDLVDVSSSGFVLEWELPPTLGAFDLNASETVATSTDDASYYASTFNMFLEGPIEGSDQDCCLLPENIPSSDVSSFSVCLNGGIKPTECLPDCEFPQCRVCTKCEFKLTTLQFVPKTEQTQRIRVEGLAAGRVYAVTIRTQIGFAEGIEDGSFRRALRYVTLSGDQVSTADNGVDVGAAAAASASADEDKATAKAKYANLVNGLVIVVVGMLVATAVSHFLDRAELQRAADEVRKQEEAAAIEAEQEGVVDVETPAEKAAKLRVRLSGLKQRTTGMYHQIVNTLAVPDTDRITLPSLELSQDLVELSQQRPSCRMGLVHHAFFYRRSLVAEHCLIRTVRDAEGESTDILLIQNMLEMLITGSLRHKNVIKVAGMVAHTLPLYLVFDFGDEKHGYKGTLESVLEKGAPGQDTRPLDLLQTSDQLGFAVELACGMEYIEDIKLVLKTLQACTVYISDKNIVKIANLWGPGLLGEEPFRNVKNKYTDKLDDPQRTAGGKYNDGLRFMAPEVLDDVANFTHNSDVWSFGLVLWQIFTYGGLPFPHLTLKEVFDQRPRPDTPEDAPSEVGSIMERCWAPAPKDRPSFDKLHKWLRQAQEAPAADEFSGVNNGYMAGGDVADAMAGAGGGEGFQGTTAGEANKYEALDLNAMYGTGGGGN
jgi:hypothetical protein